MWNQELKELPMMPDYSNPLTRQAEIKLGEFLYDQDQMMMNDQSGQGSNENEIRE